MDSKDFGSYGSELIPSIDIQYNFFVKNLFATFYFNFFSV